MSAAEVLREGRARAGLSQRALAKRAGTTQSVVARIEGGQASPTWHTLARLIRAAGLELLVTFAVRPVADSHTLDDMPRILALTPEARLLELGNFSRVVTTARRV